MEDIMQKYSVKYDLFFDFWSSIKIFNISKVMNKKLHPYKKGKKSALEQPKDAKSMTSEDAMGRRTWDNAGFAALAETRLKK